MRQVWDLFKTMKAKDVVNDETLFRELKDRFGSPFGFGEYFRGGMGAEAVRDLLQQVDLEAESEDLQDQVKTARGQKQARAVKRLKVVTAFLNSGNKPEMMILEAVPVIPPELRPMVQLDGGRFATSDLNDLYRRVINRNNRLKRLLDLGAPEIIVNNEKRMLQEAVDALFDNGRRGRPVTGPGNRPLKSLSDMLKGKQGRFRQNLLGKRVDYSGRSVIVSGPSLRLHQCGLPKLMALELFKPFIMARLVERKSAQNIKAAKKMVDSMIPEVWDVLEEVIHEHPVLLNRAPTLHRLGIQAFEPILVEGKAIQVHPLVCHAFNADFDGDQMAVHLPLSAEAQAEARILMLSANNILSPAHGAPLATPTQDMVLGAYYLTYGPDQLRTSRRSTAPPTNRARTCTGPPRRRSSPTSNGEVKLHDLAEFRPLGREGGHVLTTVGRIIYNDRIERALVDALGDQFNASSYEFINRSMRKKDTTRLVDDLVQKYGAATISQVLDAFKDVGFQYATRAGVTISKNDVVRRRRASRRSSPATTSGSPRSMISTTTARWTRRSATRRSRSCGMRRPTRLPTRWSTNLDELNPIFMMANSGARGSFQQIRQLAGMRGLMANPKGEIIERPIKSNFMEGLDVLEYFISTHGARKGLADTALRTADSGYLTRRLVDVAQDVIIRQEDCGTTEYIQMPIFKPEIESADPAPASDQRAERQPDRPHRGGSDHGARRPRDRREGRGDRPRRARRSRGELRGPQRRRADPRAGPLGAQVRGPDGRLPGVLRPLDGDRQARTDRRRGRHHRRAVDRRAGHAADDADLPHRRRRRRGHHARSAARGRAVRGAQAEGPCEDRRGRRPRVVRGDRQVGHGRDHRRGRRGAPPHLPAADDAVRPGRRGHHDGHAAQRGLAVSARDPLATAPRTRSSGAPRPSCTSSTRCRRSTSPRAWTSTTSTSS